MDQFCLNDCWWVTIAASILRRGFNVNSLIRVKRGNKIYDTTLLIVAMDYYDIPMINLLLEYKQNLSIVDKNSDSALLRFSDDFKDIILNLNICGDTNFTQRAIKNFEALKAEQHI